jgi:hypothetical protein
MQRSTVSASRTLRVAGVGARAAPRSPLAQQVPAAVELDLDPAQLLLVGLEGYEVRAVGLLARARLVLLGGQRLDGSAMLSSLMRES